MKATPAITSLTTAVFGYLQPIHVWCSSVDASVSYGDIDLPVSEYY